VHDAGNLAHQEQHGGGGQQAGHDADGEQPPVADGHDQHGGQQRSGDRPDRVHGPLHAEGAAELRRWNGPGQQAVAGGSLAAPGDP
jgi:hypothetical protein